jgi:N-acetylmuramoyl-L-alanine amidase
LIAPLLLASALLLSGSPGDEKRDEKRIAIYSTNANYTLVTEERNGLDYVALRDVLAPLGKVSVKTDGLHWKIRCNNVEADFTAGSNRTRIHGQEFTLPAAFVLDRGNGLVPLSSLSVLLSRFLDVPLRYYENSRRFFIGDVGVHFTAQVSKTDPANLVLDFSSPVNPMVATEPGKLRMVFTHEPLLSPGTATLTFDSRTIPSAAYMENNAADEIVINGSVPLLATFSNNGRTITISSAPQNTPMAGRAAPQMSPPTQNPGQPAPVTTAPAAAMPSAPSIRYFAVVDASHGGDERGAALDGQLAEKDVNLALARQLRQALAARGLTTLVLRDGDMTLSLDERANLANRTHPAIYICIHATSEGSGVRLYTALLPAGRENHGPFVDWQTAQANVLAASQSVTASLTAEFQKRQIPIRKLIAPLRPLNNILAVAVAIEVAPPRTGAAGLNSPAYQQLVAESLANGIITVRDQLGAAQ